MPSPGGSDSRSTLLCRRAASMPDAGAAFEGNCPFEGECKAKAALAAGAGDKRKAARAFCRNATLPECLPKANLSCLKMSPPGGGRRARYGKLRFPSCAPFHPPGTPLPLRLCPLVASRPVRLLGKASVSGTRLLEPSVFSSGRAGLTRYGLQGRAYPGEVLREATSDCEAP